MNTNRTIAAIRLCATGIMAIACAVSYTTQRDVLRRWDVDELSAYAIPLTVDLLAIICTLAIHTPGVEKAGRALAIRVLAVAGTASITANVLAGATWGSRIAHGWAVVAYLLAEGIAARVRGGVPAVAPELTSLTPTEAIAPVAAVLAEPSIAPVSPAPAGRPIWAPELVKSRPLPASRRPVRQMRILSQEGSTT